MEPPPLLAGLGEVLLDRFPDGDRLGGAPANVAWYARQLGARGAVISAVGDDALGAGVLRRLSDNGLDVSAVAVDPAHPTGTVEVELSADGQPRYAIREDAAWDHIPAGPEALGLAAGADILAYGTLARRAPGSRKAMDALVAATRPECLRVFDINLRPPFVGAAAATEGLRGAALLKLNNGEWPVLLGFLGLPGDGPPDAERAGLLFGRAPGLRWVALTEGARGARLFARDGRAWQSDAPAVRVADAVGAGDAFTAALALDLWRGDDPGLALRRACRVGAHVCSRPGATVALPESWPAPFP